MAHKKANIVIVGAGRGGTALLEILHKDPMANILGIVDINPDARGIQLARKMGLKVSKKIDPFLGSQSIHVDIILDVTGQDGIRKHLASLKSPDTRMISGMAARFLWALIDTQRDKNILELKYNELKASLSALPNEEMIFGTNPQMQLVRQLIHQVAPTPATILITGETGTGKEMIAAAVHRNSHLRDFPFIKINCTAFSPQLLESELFGHVKGAFTGAISNKQGLLEKGDGGTIFLDEIGDISLDMQVKMLRFFQFGEIRAVGSTETKIVNARIITATNQNLLKLIKKKKFRQDLFYRLNSFIIDLPPLRERKEDIPVLAYHFLVQAVSKINKKVQSISSDAIQSLNEYLYPGNIRELHSIIERAVILCTGDVIEPEHLPLTVQKANDSYDYKKGLFQSKEEVINQFERQALQHYLIQAKGNVTKATTLARVPRRTFYRMMEKHGIHKDIFKKY